MAVPSATVVQYFEGILRVAPTATQVTLYSQVADAATLLNVLEGAAVLQVNPITRLYQAAFNRVPDSAGLTAWTQIYVNGPNAGQATATKTLAEMTAQFATAPEFTATYGANPLANAASQTAFISAMYNNVLARVPTTAEVQGWVNRINVLQQGGASNTAILTDVLNGFAQSGEFIANTASYIQGFQSKCALGTETYTGTLWAQGTPNTYTMTTGVDVITGDYNLSAVTVGGGAPSTGTTLNVFDTVNVSGPGINTLTLNAAATAVALDATNAPTLNGIDAITINNLSGGSSLAGGIAPNATSLTLGSYSAASAFTVTAANAGLTTFNINGGTQSANDLTVTYATGATAGAADTVALNLSAVNATTAGAANDALLTFNGAATSTSGIENFTIAATGTNELESLVSLKSAGGATALNQVTVSGSGSLSVDTALAFNTTTNAGTINASTNTGGVSFTVGAQDITFTGGTGNDTLAFNAAGALNANDSITMGGGFDTIIVADTAVDSTTTALNAAINNTGAERVGFSAAASVDMSYVTAAQVLSNANVDTTITKLASTDTVVVTGAGAARDLTLTASLGYNTLNLEFDALNGTAATACTVGATGQSTINIVSTADASSASVTNLTGVLTNSANAVINVSGNGNISIGDADAGDALAASASVNASTLTGKLTVIASSTASSIVGGLANDTITGGTGNDTLAGGAGNDTIATGASATAAGADTVIGGLGADAISASALTSTANSTVAYSATAAESYASSTATGTNYADTLTMGAITCTGVTQTVTFTTGVLSNQSGSLTTTSTAPVIGTTTVSNYGFVVYAAGADEYYAYQDTDGSGVINAGDFMVKIVGNSDTETFAVTSGKLVFTNTGA